MDGLSDHFKHRKNAPMVRQTCLAAKPLDWDNFGKNPLNGTSVGKLEEKLVNSFFIDENYVLSTKKMFTEPDFEFLSTKSDLEKMTLFLVMETRLTFSPHSKTTFNLNYCPK